jgi:hypothetical protein
VDRWHSPIHPAPHRLQFPEERQTDHSQLTSTFLSESSLSLDRDFAVHHDGAFPSDDSEAGRLSPVEDADSDSQVTTMMCRTIG